jgi:peptidoglycan-associated lipoprotein
MTTRTAMTLVAASTLTLLTGACADNAKKEPPKAAVAQDDEAARKKAEEEAARQRAAAELAARNAKLAEEFDFAPIHFAYDSTELDSDAQTTLSQAAKYLGGQKQVRVTISGHADERGTSEYNLALGEQRAKQVKKYLSQLGVDDQRIGTITFGELQPIDTSHTESGFAKNRRAELSPK